MIYILDKDPFRAAEYLCDSELIRTAPLILDFLCAANVLIDGPETARSRMPNLMLSFEVNASQLAHWAASDLRAFEWLVTLGASCCEQYQTRFRRPYMLLETFRAILSPLGLGPPVGTLRGPPQVIGIPNPNGAVEGYRKHFFHFVESPHWSPPVVIPIWYMQMVNKEICNELS